MIPQKVVYKYVIDGLGKIELAIPKDAKPVHFGVDGNGNFCLWAEVADRSIPNHLWNVGLYGTGHPFEDDGATHLGSVVTREGFVFHLYRHPDQ